MGVRLPPPGPESPRGVSPVAATAELNVAYSGVAQEVIRRLVLQSPAAGRRMVRRDELCAALIGQKTDAAWRLVRRLLDDGETIETVYVDFLGAAERSIALAWELNQVSGSKVTVAAARIYAIVRQIIATIPNDTPPDGRHAVLMPVPGDRHTLGATMAADLLRRDGWQIDFLLGLDQAEAMSCLDRADASIVVLSGAGLGANDPMTGLVAEIRRIAPEAKILVAGGIARRHPEVLRRLDIDGWAGPYDAAKRELERLATADAMDTVSHRR